MTTKGATLAQVAEALGLAVKHEGQTNSDYIDLPAAAKEDYITLSWLDPEEFENEAGEVTGYPLRPDTTPDRLGLYWVGSWSIGPHADTPLDEVLHWARHTAIDGVELRP